MGSPTAVPTKLDLLQARQAKEDHDDWIEAGEVCVIDLGNMG